MWNKYLACKNLGIPYRIIDMDNHVGGYSQLKDRFIHINKSWADKDRVWIHEIAHTLLHFQNFAASVGGNAELNAMAELEADTVAYIAAKVIGKEDREVYLKYVKMFMGRLPVLKQSGDVLDARMPELLKLVKIILNAGGYIYG